METVNREGLFDHLLRVPVGSQPWGAGRVGAGMWALGASMTHGVEVTLHPGQAAGRADVGKRVAR